MKHHVIHKVVFLLVFFATYNIATAQEFQLIKNLTVEDGLPSNNVYSIIEDEMGFLWMATDEGVVKYDGENIKTFTTATGLLKNDVYDLKMDNRGRIWIFSRARNIQYIKNDVIHTTYSEHPSFFFEDFWEYEDGIVFKNHFERNDTIFAFSEVDYGHVPRQIKFAFSDRDSIQVVAIEKVDTFRTQLEHSKNASQEAAYRSYFHSSSHFYFSRLFQQLVIIDFVRDSTYYVQINQKSPSQYLIYKNRNYEGTIQLTNRGLFYEVLDTKDELVRVGPKAYKYCKYATAFVRLGKFFVFSSLNQGLFFFLENNFQSEDLELSNASSLLAYNDSLLIVGNKLATIKLLSKNYEVLDTFAAQYNSDRTVTEIRKSPFPAHIAFLVAGKFVEKIKLDSINYKLFPIRRLGEPIGAINFIEIDGKSVVVQRSEIVSYLEFKADNNLDKTVFRGISNDLLYAPQDSLLIIGRNGFITFYDMKKDSTSELEVDFNVITMDTSGNHILMGTDGQGVYSMNLKSKEITKVLDNSSVLNINATQKDILVSTTQGVYHLENEPPFNKLKYLSTADGLWSNKIILSELFNDEYLYLSDKGVQNYPADFQPSDEAPTIYLNHPQLLYENTLVLDSTRDLSLDIEKIDYGGIPLKYSYSLSTREPVFQEISSTNISFRDLAPGNYELKVYGENNERNMKTDTITRTIKVPHRFYETTLFKVGSTILFTSLLSLVIVRRFRKLKKETEQKLELEKEYASIELQALQSQLNPHFVFNCLSSIQRLVSNNEVKQANNYLNKFSRLMRKFLEQSSLQFTTLQEELEINRLYLELEKLRFKEKLNYQIEVDENIDPLKIMVPAVIIQPYVENAIRHGLFHKKEKGEVIIRVQKEGDSTYIYIIDDGIGIEAVNEIYAHSKVKHESMSTRMMDRKQQLLNVLEGTQMEVQIKDRKPEGSSGTIVQIKLTENQSQSSR